MTISCYRNFSQVVTMRPSLDKDGRNLLPDDLGIIEDGTIVFDDEKILWVGQDKDLPNNYQKLPFKDCSLKTVLPEIVDCHTHTVFAGDRAHEYSMRLNGANYEDIAKAGGGILNTMHGTNQADGEELFTIAKERIERINSYGVGTVEIKSGYGLNFKKEYEISHVIDRLKKHFAPKVRIINTYMAAHAIPKNFSSSKEYMNQIVIPLLIKLSDEKIIDVVDIFHEQGYFDSADTKLLFETARRLGIAYKSHADEFYDNKGALLAAQMGAISTDHLLATTQDGIDALAKSKTVATLLPGTGFFLGKPQANARKFLDCGAKVAIGSDYNPGSCHWDNVISIASMAAFQYKMNLCELWTAITLNAAHALGIYNQGAIAINLAPRFSIFNCASIDKITYSWGRNLSATKGASHLTN